MKTSGKQDEAWIMNRLIKQLTDMGFPVTGVLFLPLPSACAAMHGPDCVLPAVVTRNKQDF